MLNKFNSYLNKTKCTENIKYHTRKQIIPCTSSSPKPEPAALVTTETAHTIPPTTTPVQWALEAFGIIFTLDSIVCLVLWTRKTFVGWCLSAAGHVHRFMNLLVRSWIFQHAMKLPAIKFCQLWYLRRRHRRSTLERRQNSLLGPASSPHVVVVFVGSKHVADDDYGDYIPTSFQGGCFGSK